MRREKEEPDEVLAGFDLNDDENIVAYCTTCGLMLFKGNDNTPYKHRVLKEQLFDHLSSYKIPHQILVTHPKRQNEQVTDAKVFLSTGSRLTANDYFWRIKPN